MCVVAQAGLPTLSVREIAVGIQSRDWSLIRDALHWFPRVTLIASVLVGAALLAGMWIYNWVSNADAPVELTYARSRRSLSQLNACPYQSPFAQTCARIATDGIVRTTVRNGYGFNRTE